MTVITRENFTAAIRKAVEDRGEDYVYPQAYYIEEPDSLHFQGGTCRYANRDTGEPACIIGQALFNIDPELLPNSEDSNSAGKVLEERGVFDIALLSAARTAQADQDQGQSWGTALDEFERALKHFSTHND